MKVLITGAAGFIGSHLSQAFLKTDDEVWGVDNLTGSYPTTAYQLNLNLLKAYSNFSYLQLDLRVPSDLDHPKLSEQFDLIIHAAALTGVRDSAARPIEYMSNNVLGTHHLLEKYSNSLARFIVLSSSSVYGDQGQVPFSEELPTHPQSVYAISKQSTEHLAEYYAYHKNLAITVVRPFSVYGPRGRLNMLPALLIKAALNQKPFSKFGTNATNKRDWTYVDDFVAMVRGLAAAPYTGFAIFNLGSSSPVGIDDYVSLCTAQIKKYFKIQPHINKTDKPNFEMDMTYADISRLTAVIGNLVPTKLDDGLEKTVRYFADHRSVYFD